MHVRPLDSNGDITPVYDLSQLISGSEAISQVINLRLHFLYGEWWEDEEMGFRIPDFLVANARRRDVELLAKYVSAYISETQEVRAVTGIVTGIRDHTMTFRCSVLTTEGQNASVEVNLNGIL